ncbi:MAG: acetoin dehydrogenase dihydrolipoyllysine-residue acetyltransferase subunit, partial [Acetobacteraceae bacterium]|nr:acetoin dehydrogenase dihydrolipoyllysine-residue acetyltransferase subunit [Acetobacteraceae bacterium]
VDEGETVPVGALLGVIADDAVSDADIEAFVSDFQAKFAESQAATAGAAQQEPEVVEADGIRLRYLKLGDAEGDPVIFLHGYGADLNNWLFNQPAIAEHRTTYALDLPGHGGSTKDVGEGTVPALAKAVLAFMRKLGIERAHLVGHSMGGAVALELAAHSPDKVASVTVICPAGLGPEISMEFINGFIEANRRKKMEPVLRLLVANPDLVTGEMIEDVLKFKRLDGVDSALKKLRDNLFAGGRQASVLTDEIAALRGRVQVIWGRQDQIIPASQSERLPNQVKVSVLDDAGHLAHMEKANEVNALIQEQVAPG